MSKNAIHNFNLSIQNSADIKSSEELTKAIIKELAKVSKEMSQQKDTVQEWQEQKNQNATAVTNNYNSLSEGGATDTIAETNNKTALSISNTPSGSEEIKSNYNALEGDISSVTTSVLNALIEGGVADTTGRTTMTSNISDNTTSPILGTENNTLNFSNGITTQTYANVAGQQTLTVPQMLQTNSSEPTIEALKEEIKKKFEAAIIANNTVEIEYWKNISKAFEEGAKAQDFYGKPNDTLFTEMYTALQQVNQVVASQNFDWESVRKRMIESIDHNILKGEISSNNKIRWELIKKQLNDDTINVANLFERYDELFLLLKVVEGLDNLPSTITIITRTKIYPNLSADKVYAEIGKEAIYVRLKQVSETNLDGSGVNKGAVKIKNTKQTSFIAGESLEFFVDEAFINQKGNPKENINWVVYNSDIKKENIFKNEGTSFSYNFDMPGKYRIDAYGKNHTIKQKKNLDTATFIELNIVKQHIFITPPVNAQAEFIRSFTEEKNFKVSLKNTAVKTLNPVKLYFQVETIAANKITKISEEQELNSTGIIKLAMPDLGEYKIKVISKDQYALAQEFKTSVIKNEVTSIGLAENMSSNNILLLGIQNKEITLETKKFKINPPTDNEKEDVRWMIYDSNNKPYITPETVLFTNRRDTQKSYIHKWKSFSIPIPKKVGHYTVEAFSDRQKGAKTECVYKIEVKHPQINEAYWAWSGGSKKVTSGFSGESNYIKAQIPYYENQTVRVYFYLNNAKTNYYIDVKTNEKGEIFEEVKFDAVFQKEIGFRSGGNAKIAFKLLGIQDSKPYPFKASANYESDTVLSVTTDKKILDVYFTYDGSRVKEEDEVPFGKKGAVVTLVAKTQNMVGEEIELTAHRIGEAPSFNNKAKVSSEGVAMISFTLISLNKKLKNGSKVKYYAGVEGYSTKHLANKVLVMIVGEASKGKNIANLTWGSLVNQEFREKVIEICEDLWPENTIEMANGLMAVMYRETNKTFAANQMAGYKSLIPRNQMTAKDFENDNKKTGERGSRAVGLIQFTQAALVSMKEFKNGEGFDKLHALKLSYAKMTELEQLEKVRKYFKNVARLPKVPEDIYVAVFSPGFVGKESTDTLYKKGTDSYDANPGLDKNNNGIQKSELLVKYYESLKEGNKSDNIASVSFEKRVNVCPKGKCIHYEDVVKNPKINNQSNDIDKNRWHRKMRVNKKHPKGYYHTGVDILAAPNTSLKSLLCGTVTIAGDTYGDLGIIVIVKSKDKEDKDVWIEYCHLSSTSVVAGQVIKHGQEIGLSGYTGNAKDVLPIYYHVHIEASLDGVFYSGKNRVDPELFMKTKF